MLPSKKLGRKSWSFQHIEPELSRTTICGTRRNPVAIDDEDDDVSALTPAIRRLSTSPQAPDVRPLFGPRANLKRKSADLDEGVEHQASVFNQGLPKKRAAPAGLSSTTQWSSSDILAQRGTEEKTQGFGLIHSTSTTNDLQTRIYSRATNQIKESPNFRRTIRDATLSNAEKNIRKEPIGARTTASERTHVIELLDDSSDDSDADGDTFNTAPLHQPHPRITPARRPTLLPRILKDNNFDVPGVRCNNVDIHRGSFVEFKDGTFMKVSRVQRAEQNNRILVGQIYSRISTLGPHMPLRRDGLAWVVDAKSGETDTRFRQTYLGQALLNEVVQKVRTVSGEHREDFGLWRRSATDVKRARELRATNQDYNDFNCITDGQAQGTTNVNQLWTKAILTCRWVETIVHDKNGKRKEERLERPNNVDSDWQTSSDDLRRAWRGHSAILSPGGTPITLCDSYCGAGGMSCGAEQAGLTILISFDKDGKKISTHKANFPNCKSYEADVSQFIKRTQKGSRKVHVLHLSPPCQPFSSNNTRPNEAKNELNQPPLLACADVIKGVKPRIVTIEEAPGIVQRHHPWFYALINQFTEIGFSLRWSFITCSEFGVPQTRKRFMIIAAAPGEALPPFPSPTHTTGSITIKTVLDSLERAHARSPLANHEKNKTSHRTRQAPYDPDCLAKTITCGGNENRHPSGERPFTARELACLQTFPHRYKFGTKEDGSSLSATEIKVQVGNAVPPNLGKAVMLEVAKSLWKTDSGRRNRGMAAREAIELD